MKNKFFNSIFFLLLSIHLSAQCGPEDIPTAQCANGLVIELLPVDTNGDGLIDDCHGSLFASEVNSGSFDATSPAEDLVFYFNDNPDELLLSFNSTHIGENNITLYVADTDGCVSSCNTVVLLESSSEACTQCEASEAPTALCLSGLVIELLPLDTNGDGFPDECFAEIFAQMFDAGSFDNTTASEDLSFYFNNNPEDLIMQFDGDNIGLNNLTIYVENADGCVSTCSTTLFIQGVQPNTGFCGDITEPEISGHVKTIQNEGIKNVEVFISETVTLTDENGAYSAFINQGGDYNLSCYKNNNPSNGVTGADLIIMRQHILTIDLIENPVYLLAADVNNNGSITTADLVATRQVILGNADTFPNNTSWRFYYGDINTGEIIETLIFNSNGTNNEQINWTGYKVGDVNGSAVPE